MKRNQLLGLTLAFLAMTCFLSVACDRVSNPVTSPDWSFTQAPASQNQNTPTSAPQSVVEEPAQAPSGAIEVELLSSNFDPRRCTDLSLPKHQGKSVLEEVAKITNNTNLEAYPFPALFQTRVATCDAHDRHPAGEDVTSQLVIGANIAPGQSGEWTHRFALPPNACGSFQFDNDARNGEIAQSTLSGGAGGKVINTGEDCPDCVEEWIEQEPEIEYGEWGECESVGSEAQCARSKTNIVTIYEVNSCTEERRVKLQEEVEETEACECPSECVYEQMGNFCNGDFTASNGTPPSVECGWLGLSSIGKDDFETYVASQNATAVIVKAGQCYTFFYGVEQGDPLWSHMKFVISHATYCGCD